jgi:RNA polymerase sigma factor (sigma-70 family)
VNDTLITGSEISELVTGAREGDQDSWSELVERHQPIIDAVTRRYRLGREDAADLSQTVWLQLTCHLDTIRDPRALPGWIKVTAEREAFRLIRVARRTISLEPITGCYEGQSSPAELRFSSLADEVDVDLLRHEERVAIREGLATLNPNQRELLLMLVAEPAVSYAEISAELGVPIGSIGPTRARCLRKLEAAPAVQALLATGDGLSLAA